MSDLKDLLQRAEEIRLKYEKLNAKNGKEAWRIRDYSMGLVGDIGELTRLVMAKENLRDMEETDEKLGQELADCLWGILIISKYYGIDLEAESRKKLDTIQKKVEEKYES